MIGHPVTIDTPVGAPILVARGGDVVHVGAFISGDSDTSAYGRVVVELSGMSIKFDAENGYIWRVIPPDTAKKLNVNLDAEMSHFKGAREARERINRITKVKP